MKTTKKASKPSITRPRVRINRPDDIRRLLNKEINHLLVDETTTDKLRAVTYASHTILRVFEIILMEERLTRIEKQLDIK